MNDKQQNLPKHIIMMVEKGNLVNAIKNLSSEDNISMDEAKRRIDAYEEGLKRRQQKQQQKIVQKQEKTAGSQANTQKNGFENLNLELDKHLANQGYKKPLLPYWVKRVILIIMVIAVFCLLGWRLFTAFPALSLLPLKL